MPQGSLLGDARHAYLRRLLARRPPSADATMAHAEQRDEYPLSSAQRRFWLLAQLAPDSAAYHVPVALRLRGRLDRHALQQTLDEIVRRHSVLRTRIVERDGEPWQRVDPASRVPLPVIDLSALPDADRLVTRVAGADVRRPFDLTRGPVLRACLIRVTPDDQALIVTIHHIASDGDSVGIIVQECNALYGAYVAGEPSPLPEPGPQYGDFALWQRAAITEERVQAQLAYWRHQLADLAPLELPTDHPRQDATTYRAGSLPFHLPPRLTDRLREVSRREGVSLFMLIAAGLQVLFGRYSGQHDVAIGTVAARRPRPELNAVVGLFINALVLRTRLTPGLTFRVLLSRIRETVLDAFAHQDVPFETIVETLAADRRASQMPLFNVLFAFQQTTARRLRLPGLEITAMPIAAGHAKYELDLSMTESEDGIAGVLEYAADLFEPATIARFLDHLWTLLDAATLDVGRPLQESDHLDARERALTLVEWNATTRAWPDDRPLHARLTAQAAERPDAIAVVMDGDHLTYAELDRRSTRLALVLRGFGAGPDHIVGLLLDRSLELVIGLLGVLKAGGAYLPLDPGDPHDRLQYMLGDARVSLIVAQGAAADAFAAARRVFRLDGPWPEVDTEAFTPAPANPEALAYVLYTSGSSGRPKAVAIPHRGLTNHLWWIATAFNLDSSDVLLQKTAITFDASVSELAAPLAIGARLAMAGPGEHRDAERLVARIQQYQVTVAQFVPSVLGEVARDPAFEACRSLRALWAGGEIFTRDLLVRLAARRPIVYANFYGPTEASIDAVVWSGTSVPSSAINVPIGVPLPNFRAYVLDSHGRPAAIGIPGELFIGGAGLARGYLHKAAATAERFAPDPFSGEPGARLYRTGDRVRWCADGSMEYLGRLDHQVKLRGHRIELGEIEAALAELPGVERVAVMLREDPPAPRRLVAYIVPAPQVTPSIAHWRAALQDRLPAYMLPSGFVVLDRLPLTAHGKLNRAALPPAEANVDEMTADARPREGLEELIAAIWSELLHRDGLGRDADFFALGGHSLVATQIVSRLRHTLGLAVPLRAIFDTRTIAGLAARLQAARGESAPVVPPVTAVPRPIEGLPLSFAQQRLWFLAQLDPSSATYNLPYALRMRGSVDQPALLWSLRAIVARHEILRTRIVTHGGRPTQQVDPAATIALPIVDLSALPDETRGRAAMRMAALEAARPFVLAEAPLLRGCLLRLADDECVLLLTLSHLACDGWSMGLLTREFGVFYRGFAARTPAALPALPVQYGDVAVWQRAWLTDDVLERLLAYWRAQLVDLAPLMLPTDRPRTAAPSRRGGVVSFTWDVDLSHAVADLGRREGVTPFMLLLAGFAIVLGRWAGQRDVAIGTDIANRHHFATEHLIGFFVNQLVLRLRLDGAQTFRGLLAQARDLALGAYAHQDLPFERLVADLAPSRDLSRAPLFQVTLLVQNTPVETLTIDGVRIEGFEAATREAETDLTLAILDTAPAIAGSLHYAAELFDRETATRLVKTLRTVLAQAAARPDDPIDTLPLMDAREEQRWLATVNPAPVTLSGPACLHELFDEWAARTPDACALVGEGAHVSYGELQQRARHVAAFLRQEGIGPGTLVAICLERSPELIVALLGALIAGAAYVPLDAGYPADRLAFMLEDSGATLLLAHAATAGRVAASRTRQILIDRDWPAIVARAVATDAPPLTPCHPDSLAYVTYTSGSTGRPKGVMNAHRAVRNRLVWLRDALHVSAGERILQKTPITFDVSVGEVFGTLAGGATLVLARPGGHRDAEYVARVLADERVTMAHFVPSMLDAFLALDRNGPLPALRRVLCSGEALGPEVVRRFHQRLDADLYNLYGPTETAIEVTVWKSDPRRPEARVPIGVPIANARLYVLDDQASPQPVGVPGELFIGGIAVGRGYLHQTALTAERFVPDPFSPDPGARMYRTGDRAAWRADGTIDFLGRLDRQIKIRGFRVEPGEIEAALTRQPGIRQAAVVIRDDESGPRRIIAYVAADPVDTAGIEMWRSALKAMLPDYMTPAAFVVLPELPLSPSGKLDHRALPAPAPPPTQSEGGEPRNDLERILCAIWRETLRVPRVGIQDNFFQLGGDSILSVQIVARARQHGIALTVRQIFAHQTIAALAAAAGTAIAADAPQGPVTGDVPLTPIQHWLIAHTPRNPAHQNQAIVLRVAPSLERSILARALARLIEHHDALRMRFHRDEHGAWRQTNAASERDPAPLTLVDLSALPAAARSLAMASATHGQQASLDLSGGPLLRAFCFITGAGLPHRLCLTIHHLVVDGVSWRILIEDLETAARDLLAGRSVRLPAKSASFQQWATQVAARAMDEDVRGQRAFWLEQIRADGRRPLPCDDPAGADTHGRAAMTAFALDRDETRNLIAAAPTFARAPVEPLLLAGLARAIGAWSGADEVVVDLEGHGREESIAVLDVSRTVGCFTLFYPVRLPAGRFGDETAHAREVAARLEAVPARGTAYGLLRYLGKDTPFADDHACPVEISFNYLGQLDAVFGEPDGGAARAPIFSAADDPVGPLQDPDDHRTHAIQVTAYLRDGRAHVAIGYGAARYQAETIQWFAGRYRDALRALAARACGVSGTPAAASQAAAWFQARDLDEILQNVQVHSD